MFQAADSLNNPVRLSGSIWRLLNPKSIESRVECMEKMEEDQVVNRIVDSYVKGVRLRRLYVRFLCILCDP